MGCCYSTNGLPEHQVSSCGTHDTREHAISTSAAKNIELHKGISSYWDMTHHDHHHETTSPPIVETKEQIQQQPQNQTYSYRSTHLHRGYKVATDFGPGVVASDPDANGIVRVVLIDWELAYHNQVSIYLPSNGSTVRLIHRKVTNNVSLSNAASFHVAVAIES